MEIVNITTENASKHSFFCIKDTKEAGFHAKLIWFKKRQKEGLKLKVAYADDGKQIGFIEYVPAEFAWRPVDAMDWLFIHCIMVYPNKYRHSGTAIYLINAAINDAQKTARSGVCTMTSQGPWIATNKVFSKTGFTKVDKRGRFELMALQTKEDTKAPKLLDWESKLSDYQGWHLLYADQCPWHDKGVKALINTATEIGIKLNVKQIESAEEARQSPSGFGVFALIHDGKLLEDHYISKRRFETIIENELGI
jgi:L-amino acid N-acyltransferase YncA